MLETAAPCPHFGICGGCVSQHIPYPAQLCQKASFLEDLLREFWAGPIPITPSPVLFHYRNKIDPGFALKRYPEPPSADFVRESILGFKERGRWRWTVELEDCLIGPAGVKGLLDSMRRWRIQSGLAACDSRKGTGFLRNLLVRDGKRSGERMVVLITAPGTLPDANAFVAAVQEQFHADSIYHGEFSRKAEVATAEKLTLLCGAPWITEMLYVSEAEDKDNSTFISPAQFIGEDHRKVLKLQFRISPLSFFQTNPLAAERLYSLVRGWAIRVHRMSCTICMAAREELPSVAPSMPIPLSVLSRFRRLLRRPVNGRENRISNVSFVTATVREF